MSEIPNPDQDQTDYNAEVRQTIEMGTSNMSPLVGWNAWRNDAYLTRNRPVVSLDKLVQMRRTDGQARAIAGLLTLPIKLALTQGRWVSPPEGGADDEVEFANLMWTLPPMLGGMTTTASDAISQMLLAVFDGFAPFELVTHIPDSGPLKGKRTLRKIAYRDPRTVTLLQDAHGGYAGFRQNTVTAGGKMLDVTLSPNKTVLFTVRGEENPLYGVSFFESAYPHYESKLKWYYISEMAGQFSAVPGRIGTVPRYAKPTDVAAFKKAMENFYFNTTMLKMDGYTVEPFNAASGFNFIQYIDHHNMMMSKSVLASFFESDQRTVLVENNTQDAAADLFLLSMETLANQFANVLTNHVMPKYIRENFKNSTAFPVFKPGPLSDNARSNILSLFKSVMVSGVLNCTPELARELEKHVTRDLGLDIDYAEISEREEAAALQQSEMAEALAAQTQQQTIEEERAAEGGLPTDSATSPNPQSPSTDNAAALSGPAYDEAVDTLVLAVQKLFEGDDLHEPVQVDEGL